MFKQAGKLRRERIDRGGEENRPVEEKDQTDRQKNSTLRTEDEENKRNTGGSSDTGFFSLEHDDKRNSVNSLTSGEFLAVMAELKPGVVDSPRWSPSAEHGPDGPNKLVKAVPQANDEIVRRSSKLSTTSSAQANLLSEISRRRTMSASPGREIDEGVFETLNEEVGRMAVSPPQRRHRSLTGESLSSRKKPKHRRRHFSHGDTMQSSSFPRKRQPKENSDNSRRSKMDEKVVTTVSVSTLPSAMSPERVSTPVVMNVNGTVEVIDEYVKTIELPLDEADEEETKEEEVRRVDTAPKRRMKSMSVPRETSDGEEGVEIISVPHSTSSDFTTALPKIGAFLRGSKSYSSIKKFWSADKVQLESSTTRLNQIVCKSGACYQSAQRTCATLGSN